MLVDNTRPKSAGTRLNFLQYCVKDEGSVAWTDPFSSSQVMIGPLDVDEPVEASLNKRFPLELHWRKRPESQQGNLAKAYYRIYPQLKDEVVCFQCGAVPCPNPHNDNDKKQRLADLEFVKELAKERRGMKEELEKMKKQVSQYQKASETVKLEKIELRSQLEALEDTRTALNRKNLILEAEVKRLFALSEQQQGFIVEYQDVRFQVAELKKCLEDERQKTTKLTEDNQKLRRLMTHQSGEVKELVDRNAQLETELLEEKNRCQNLRHEVESFQGEMNKYKEQVKAKNKELSAAKKEMTSILDELRCKSQQWEHKEQELQVIAQKLREEIQRWKNHVESLETDRESFKQTVERLQQEIAMLKRKLASDTRFRQFIEVKRDLNKVRDVNESLVNKVMDYEHNSSVPVVTSKGKVNKSSPLVKGVVRPLTAILGSSESPHQGRRQQKDSEPLLRRSRQSQTPVSVRPSTASSMNIVDLDDFTELENASDIGMMEGMMENEDVMSNFSRMDSPEDDL